MKSETNQDEASLHIPPQQLEKYNRESGKKTLYLVGTLITVIVVLTVAALFLMEG